MAAAAHVVTITAETAVESAVVPEVLAEDVTAIVNSQEDLVPKEKADSAVTDHHLAENRAPSKEKSAHQDALTVTALQDARLKRPKTESPEEANMKSSVY